TSARKRQKSSKAWSASWSSRGRWCGSPTASTCIATRWRARASGWPRAKARPSTSGSSRIFSDCRGRSPSRCWSGSIARGSRSGSGTRGWCCDLQPRRRHILLLDLHHAPLHHHLLLPERQLRVIEERKTLHAHQRLVDLARHAGERRCARAGFHHREQIARKRRMPGDPELPLIAAEADEMFGGFDAEEHAPGA